MWKATINMYKHSTRTGYYCRIYLNKNFLQNTKIKEIFINWTDLKFRDIAVSDNIFYKINKSGLISIYFNTDKYSYLSGNYNIEREGDWYYLDKINEN